MFIEYKKRKEQKMDFVLLKEKIEKSCLPKTCLNFSNTGDGRLDSAESESVVIEHLKNLFKESEVQVESAPPREWYDVAFKVNNKVFYANVKITSGGQADNISSKKGLFYALTGILPANLKGVNLNNWRPYNEALLENIKYNCDSDYYFVVYFKDTESFLVTSLKRIQTLTPNGSNLPFQCKWSDNIIFSTRGPKEQTRYLMDTYYNSWLKKVSGFEPLMKWR